MNISSVTLNFFGSPCKEKLAWLQHPMTFLTTWPTFSLRCYLKSIGSPHQTKLVQTTLTWHGYIKISYGCFHINVGCSKFVKSLSLFLCESWSWCGWWPAQPTSREQRLDCILKTIFEIIVIKFRISKILTDSCTIGLCWFDVALGDWILVQ